MRSETKKLNISSVFPLLSFVLLAASIVIVLLMGARLYSRSNERDNTDYDHRTVIGYINTRISQSAVKGDFFVGDFHEAKPSESGDTFFFVEEIGGELYVTRLYCYEGALYELFSPINAALDRESGERVLSLESLRFSVKEELLTADIVFDDGESVALRVALRAGGAEIEK